jgi:hypothetical protein
MKDLERPIADVLEERGISSRSLIAKLVEANITTLLDLCEVSVWIQVLSV